MPIDDVIFMDITDDMYCGSLSADFISEFVCMICCGIVYEPIKCTRCANMVCRKCVNAKKMMGGNGFCFKKCGNNQFSELSAMENKVLHSLVFRCQHEMEGCEKRIRYGNYKSHLMNECTVKRCKKVEIAQGEHEKN